MTADASPRRTSRRDAGHKPDPCSCPGDFRGDHFPTPQALTTLRLPVRRPAAVQATAALTPGGRL